MYFGAFDKQQKAASEMFFTELGICSVVRLDQVRQNDPNVVTVSGSVILVIPLQS